MLKISLFLHVMSAIFWVGGMLFLTLVIVPFLNVLKDPAEKGMVYRAIGPRYRTYAWVAIALLCVTGPLNLHLLGVPLSSLFDPAFHATAYGRALLIKLFLVFLIIISSLLHDFWVGPKARVSPKFSFYARVFGRSNLFIAILIIICAIIIRAGGL
jgi:putative copper export protein